MGMGARSRHQPAQSASQVLAALGVCILPNRSHLLPEDSVRQIISEPPSAYSPIFNGEQDESGLRLQLRRAKWAVPFEAELADELDASGLLAHDPEGPYADRPKRVCDAYVLRSEPGCPKQPAHADVTRAHMHYGMRSERHRRLGEHTGAPLRAGDAPASALLVLEAGTSLWIYPGGCSEEEEGEGIELHLHSGDLVVWRGDVVHAGSAYAALNLRMHAYIDSLAWRRDHNHTSQCGDEYEAGRGFVVAPDLRARMAERL